MYKPSPSHQAMLDTLTGRSRAKLGRTYKAIGGGAFLGTNLGTREGFNSYTKKLVTPEFLKNSKTKLEDLTPEQRKLYNKGKLYVSRVKVVYNPKSGSRSLKNVFGDSDKIDILLGDKIPEDLTKLPEELSGRGVAATKIRKKFIKEYLESLPKGQVINLDATIRTLNEKVKKATNGKISISDKSILMDALENNEMNPNKVRKPKDLKEANQIFFKDRGYNASKELIDEKAKELNEKYKLKDKGIRFRSKPTTTGKQVLSLEFTGGLFKDKKVQKREVPLTEEGIAKLEEIIKPIVKTKEFKEYSSKEAQRQGSIKAGQTKVTYNQPELFQYLLEQKGPISKEQVIKDFKEFGYNEGVIRKAIGNLHANMYRALDPNKPNSGKFLSENYNPNQIKNVLDKVKNNFPGDFFNRTFEDLLIEAYQGNPKKYKPLANKLKKFRELQKELRAAGIGDELIAQLDHVIPFNFLQAVRAGKDPEELLRVKAYPGKLNSTAFKGAIDKALGLAVEKKDEKLIKTITELRNFLPEDMGKIDSKGKKIIDYGAKPFNLKTMYSDQQKKFGEVYERTRDFLENPKVIGLLKDAGISLRAIGQLKKLNIPGFLKTMDDILERRPDLRVEEIINPYKDIENQYASASMMSDVSPVIKKETPPEGTTEGGSAAAAGGAVLFGKYTPQILKILKNVGGKTISAVGSPTAAGLFAYNTIKDNLEEGESLPRAIIDKEVGVELLYPEIAKQLSKKAATSAPGILNALGRFALNPIGKAARVLTPTGAVITGAGLMKDYYDFVRRELERKEADPEAYKVEQEEQMGIAAAAGGLITRQGFADGPDDPNKRKFMKIMAGLGSLPILGRFFDVAQVAEKSAPVVAETIKNAPQHFIGLVNKIRALGKVLDPRKVGMASDQKRYSNIYEYGEYRMYEQPDGRIEIGKDKLIDTEYGDAKVSEEYMSYSPGKVDEKGKKIEDDSYEEYTAYSDSDGKMKDVEDGVLDDTINDGTYSKEELEQLIIEDIAKGE